MGRASNKTNLPQTPKYAKMPSDGRDVEFSQELADANDIEAQERARAADERSKQK